MIDRDSFATTFTVPRETLDDLDTFAALLVDWQTRMNLVGPATLPQIWERHFADSAQLLAHAPAGASWLDLGAGAGFPGLVIAIMDKRANVTLVESIAKKCRFLSAVRERLGLADRVEILNQRIETIPAQRPTVITARALASLEQLLDWGVPHSRPDTLWLLPKGARHLDELSAARSRFRFQETLIASRTSEDARIVRATGVARI